MNALRKIFPITELAAWRNRVRKTGRKLVATNGCFDLLHAGHVHYLEEARGQGDLLLVGLNGDASVRALKGASRPLNHEADRALLLAALECVDAVTIFSERSAEGFLSLAQPDVYIKGGDYTLDTLNPAERSIVESAGGRIIIVPFVPGRSTTGLVERILHSDLSHSKS